MSEFVKNTALLRNIWEAHFRIVGTFGTFNRSGVARVGEGHRLAARRRAWVRREDERREDASRAHWHANVIGRGVFRSKGSIYPLDICVTTPVKIFQPVISDVILICVIIDYEHQFPTLVPPIYLLYNLV